MSFDEQPDGDPHGECAFEIAKLTAINAELLAAARLVIAWYEAEDDHTKEPNFYRRVEMCREAEIAIRAAILKADGSAIPV